MDEGRAALLATLPVTRARRAALGQALLLAVVVVLAWQIVRNVELGLARQGLSLGFGFLRQPASFDIGETSGIPFSPDDSFGRAILVGLANTVRVSVLGTVLAIVLGFAFGLLRLADSAAVRGVVRAAVEVLRNTPLLLLLLLLIATLHTMPAPANAYQPLPGVFISDRGLVLPLFGRPHLAGFNFVGGVALSPEFAALLGALVLHQSAHISEVVRGAILGVPKGQRDAAFALGMSRWQVMRFVVVPQALRAMVPLLATNCVSLVKNSSLAVAIGFPDVVSILNTTANQTGHGVETMIIMVAVYLAISGIVAGLLNTYNARLVGRGMWGVIRAE
jgi:general L-amino acid transport system permease protein